MYLFPIWLALELFLRDKTGSKRNNTENGQKLYP